MNLFGNSENTNEVINKDGQVLYDPNFLLSKEAEIYFQLLLNEIPWQQDEVHLFGKKIVTKRMMSWHADTPIFYHYSGSVKQATPWTPTLLELKSRVENASKCSYNSCLLNLYHSGEEGMGWHSDNEKELKENGTIASLSLGATRRFLFKHIQTKEKIEVNLHSGGLLLMKGTLQQNWLHSLPKSKRVHTPRINLTFRTIN